MAINETLLTKNVIEVIDRKDLETKLKSKRRLVVKFGRDPTTPHLTLGHSIPLRKLRDFQRDGHQIVIVIGDITAKLGDPSGQSQTRLGISDKEIASNVSKIKSVFGKILDLKKTRFAYQHVWFGNLKLEDIIKLASNFTVQQMIERNMFEKRIQAEQPVGLHEFLYPLLQGYDSVYLKPDLEVGGTDQTFNLLAGRTLMKAYGLKPQDILTTPMLIGTDGREMHSSWGNTILLTDEPFDMFGKVMGIRDELILQYMDLTTDMSPSEIDGIASQLKHGTITAIAAKKTLAREIVSLYHNGEAANAAQQQFENVIQSKGLPDERGTHRLKGLSINLVDLLVESNLASSRSDAKRLIEQGGVDKVHVHQGEIVNRTTITDPMIQISPHSSQDIFIQVGKRKAVEVRK